MFVIRHRYSAVLIRIEACHPGTVILNTIPSTPIFVSSERRMVEAAFNALNSPSMTFNDRGTTYLANGNDLQCRGYEWEIKELVSYRYR